MRQLLNAYRIILLRPRVNCIHHLLLHCVTFHGCVIMILLLLDTNKVRIWLINY